MISCKEMVGKGAVVVNKGMIGGWGRWFLVQWMARREAMVSNKCMVGRGR
jgi:hypothetical protein